MGRMNFTRIYEQLNIPVKPLPANYSPDEYGKMLLSSATYSHGVSYSTSTDYTDVSKTVALTKKD